jgi:hypothetical protein
LQAEADDLGCEQVQGLAEEDGLGLDAPDAPAQDAHGVDHRGVRVRPHQGVRKGHHLPFLRAQLNDARQVLDVDLVHDAGAGRDDAEVVEGLLGPAQEQVALPIALVLTHDVLGSGQRRAEVIHLHRVVDHQLGRDEGIDALGVAPHPGDGGAHRRQVDHRRHAGQILHQHPGRHEGKLLVPRLLRCPPGQGGHVGLRGGAVLDVAEDVLKQHLDRKRQPVEVS